MRIAVLTNVIPSPTVIGGAGRVAYLYHELLRVRGHEIRVWGPNATFGRLGRMNPLLRLAFHFCDLGTRRITVREILEWKPDVLLTHNLTGCGFGTPRRIKRNGIRWVHFLHDVQLIEPSGQIWWNRTSNVESRKNAWRITWSAFRHAAMGEPDAVVSPTKWLLEFHREYGWFRSIRAEVIPNPLSIFSPPHAPVSTELTAGASLSAEGGSSAPPAVEQEGQPTKEAGWWLNKRGESVLYVGRVDEEKGILVLLVAWKKIAMPNARLVVIGDGMLLDHLRAQNISGVEFRGVQSPDDVRRAMEESAVVIVPSRILENQPTVILEALAAGCNVVASDVGGIAETLDGAGTLVPPGDVDALVHVIRETMDASYRPPPTAHRLLSHHDPNACVARLEGVLRSDG